MSVFEYNLEDYKNNDIITKSMLWKQGRGRSFSFIKPWRERLIIVDHKKMTLSYYNVPEGYDWENQPPSSDLLKGTIPLEEAIIEDLKDAGRPYAFALLNGEVHVNIAAHTENEKTKWVNLLQTISQSSRSEANKEKFRMLSQIGGVSSPNGKLLKQNSRLQKQRSLTPRSLAPVNDGAAKDYHSSDEEDSELVAASSVVKQQRPISYDRSRSPTPPCPPPRPVSKSSSPPTPPPSTTIDPNDIFEKAVLAAALNSNSTENSSENNGLGIAIEITKQHDGNNTVNKDVVIETPDLNQLSELQKEEARKLREQQIRKEQEELQQAEEEKRRKEKEIEEKTQEINAKLTDYRRTTFREIAQVEAEKAEFEKLKSTMTEREAAHLIASQGEESVFVKELRGELPHQQE